MRVTRKLARALLLAAVAASAGGLLLVLRASLGDENADSGNLGAAAHPVASDSADRAIELEPAPISEPAGNTSATEPEERALPDGIWIRGRVVLRGGTPADEQIEIAARVLSFDDAPGYVASVGADGSFLAMFPKEVDSGWLELRGRYLVLQPNFEVDLEEPPEEVVLEPTLGGCVRGRIVVPERLAPERAKLAGTCVKLSAEIDPALPTFHYRRVCVDEDLLFEFPALPARPRYEIRAQAKDYLPFERTLEVSPGTITDVDVELRPGARVSGRVVDSQGQPVEGAKAWRTVVPCPPVPRNIDAEAVSGADGSFTMTAVPPGEVAIALKAPGSLREVVEIGRLEDGDVRIGIEVRLRSGLISGRVEWPDGRPVLDAVVQMLAPRGNRDERGVLRFDTVQRQVYSEGRFSLEAADEGPYTLSARSPREPDVDPDDALASRESGVACLEGVRPGPSPIVLTLEPTQIVRGRVQDDLGHPIPKFTVRGERHPFSRRDFLTGFSSRGFQHPDGSFALAGLSRGSWVFVASVGHRSGERSPLLDLPNGGEPIVLVVPRGATVTGVVVDPADHPITGATVMTDSKSKTVSGEDGRFELTELPRAVEIWAEAWSFAPSKRVDLRLEPGGSSSDVRLVVRHGGGVVCEVVDVEGRPEPGRKVSIRPPGSYESREGTADAEGRIEFLDLAPGPYSLQKVFTHTETWSRTESESTLWTRLVAARLQTVAEVVEGDVTRVVIGGPRGLPIRVRGRVTADGAPAAGIMVGAASMTGAVDERLSDTTDPEGRFELAIREPGVLWLTLDVDGGKVQLETTKVIPERASVDLDLALPRGRVSGIVRSSDGAPRRGAAVTLGRVDSPSGPGAEWDPWGSVNTDETGRFSFGYLSADRYVLAGAVDARSVNVPEVRMELTVEEGGHLDGVEIRLP